MVVGVWLSDDPNTHYTITLQPELVMVTVQGGIYASVQLLKSHMFKLSLHLNSFSDTFKRCLATHPVALVLISYLTAMQHHPHYSEAPLLALGTWTASPRGAKCAITQQHHYYNTQYTVKVDSYLGLSSVHMSLPHLAQSIIIVLVVSCTLSPPHWSLIIHSSYSLAVRRMNTPHPASFVDFDPRPGHGPLT